MFMKERCQCKVNLGNAHIDPLPSSLRQTPIGDHPLVFHPGLQLHLALRSTTLHSVLYCTALYYTVLYCTVPAVCVGAALGALGVVSDPAAAVDNAGVLASPRTTRIQTIAPTLLPSSAPLFSPPSLPFAFTLNWALIVIGAWKKIKVKNCH